MPKRTLVTASTDGVTPNRLNAQLKPFAEDIKQADVCNEGGKQRHWDIIASPNSNGPALSIKGHYRRHLAIGTSRGPRRGRLEQ